MFKRLIYIFLFLVVITSCKKEDNTPKIVGKWKYVTLKGYQVTPDGVRYEQDFSNTEPGDYIEFKTDGSWTQNLEGSIQSGTYYNISNGQFRLYNSGVENICTVQTLTANSFVFSIDGTKIEGSSYTQFVHTLTK
ncbi:MAG: hypothetical protein JKY70_15700 [Mucilaginibacter sp.]|nr:hypothetical protein [Mucilaginibacter sp.]